MKSIHFPPPIADDMIRAIQADLKTVIWRVVKLKYNNTHLEMKTDKYGTRLIELQNEEPGVTIVKNPDGTTTRRLLAYIEKMPPYRPGDILYVRETWRVWRSHRYEADAHVEFKAGGEGTVLTFPNGNTDSINRDAYDRFVEKWGVSCKWHPSIHMPKEAARIFLRVTDVWVEQLKNVTEADARVEGFSSRAEFITAILKMYPDCTEENWVWGIEFERISKEEVLNESKNIH